jgi:hypothetical protein
MKSPWGEHPIARYGFPTYRHAMKYKKHFRHTDSANAEPKTPTPTMNPKETKINVRPSQAEIATNAYYIYLQQGRPHGRDVQHWLEAEAQTIGARRDDIGRDGDGENQNVDKPRTGDFGTKLLL